MRTHIRMAAAAVAVMLIPVRSEAQVAADTLLDRLTAEAVAARPWLSWLPPSSTAR